MTRKESPPASPSFAIGLIAISSILDHQNIIEIEGKSH